MPTIQPLHVEARAPPRKGFLRSTSSLFRRKSALNLSPVARRDSALGSPKSTSQGSSIPDDRIGANNAIQAVNVPAILVHEDENDILPTIPIKDDGIRQGPAKIPQGLSTASPAFRGITTRIPTGRMENPFNEGLQFSNRGSVMLGASNLSTVRRPVSQASRVDIIPETPLPNETDGMSADDRRSSQKVRSMYEAGSDEGALIGAHPTSATVQTIGRVPEEGSAIELSGNQEDAQSPITSTHSRGSDILKKEPIEPAGGIEDWQDTNTEEVDRYGFVKKTNPTSPTLQGRSINRPLSALMVDRTRPLPGQSNTHQPLGANANGKRISSGASQRLSVMSNNNKRSASALSVLSLRSDESRRRKMVRNASDMLGAPSSLDFEEPLSDPSRSALERRREAKWAKMAKPVNTSTGAHGGGTIFTFDTSNPKVISRTWKGIPDRWRASAWHSFLLHSARRQLGPSFATDAQLTARFKHLQTLDCADDAQIDTDVPRTIGGHIMFRRRYRGGQRLLFRLLRALALHFPETGYVQGMATLAATLLCYYDEEQAFVMATRLWELRGLTALYSPGFGGLMKMLDVLETNWLGVADAKLAKHLEALGVMPMAYGTKWYLTLFNYSVPFAAQLRIWDVFMLFGAGPEAKEANLDVLHAAAMALLDGMRDRLLVADFENAMKLVTAAVPVAAGREDVLMGVVKAEWDAARKRKFDAAKVAG